MTDDPLWYKDAVIYELHVRAFRDSNADGKGDFQGLRERLPWLKDLGITCLWLLPFYPSPLRDDGYDISDYVSVHPDYGTLRDFREFLSDAHRLGIRVIIELVLNHTSDQHPWFQAARRAPKGSLKRNWYVWSDDPTRYKDARIIFTDTETSNWTWDPVAGQYFWHRFFSHQPDLNYDHPAVRRAIGRVLRFWLERGVDGVRLDAVPYLVEREGTSCENLPETHAVLRDLRRIADEYAPRRIFLAEANQWPQDVIQYFGSGDECHMAYHFPLMPRLFMALAQEDAHPVREIMAKTPSIPEDCQWALFLRNHDELTLEMVTDSERDYMYRAYATDHRMRINVGIRRRLAPLNGNSRSRIELLNALLLSLPGTPVLYYGDEIGMGDNIYLGDRNGVRTPMQWSPDRNAGFSSAEFARLYSPPVMDGVYGYQGLNVEAQERDLSSLLHWTRRILGIRLDSKVFGRGSIQFVETSNRRVLAFLRRLDEEILLVVANFSRHPQPAGLQLAEFAGHVPVELFGSSPFPGIGEGDYPLALAPHGFYWFRLEAPRERAEKIRSGRLVLSRNAVPVVDVESEPMLRWWKDSAALLRLQEAVLPSWLAGRTWFEDPEEAIEACDIQEAVAFQETAMAVVVQVRRRSGSEKARFGLFLACVDGEEAELVLRQSPGSILTRLRSPTGTEMFLVDALSAPSGLSRMESALRKNLSPGAFRFESADVEHWTAGDFRLMATDLEHPVVLCGDRVLKVFHRLHNGSHPGEELLRHLGKLAFRHSPALLGGIGHGADGGHLAILMERRSHQGKADERFRESCLSHLETLLSGSNRGAAGTRPLPDLEMAGLLGQRVAEMHLCLSESADDPAFRRIPWDAIWQSRMVAEIIRQMDRLEARPGAGSTRESPLAPLRDQLGPFLSLAGALPPSGSRIRCHGDLHLGQILWNENDYVFLDFEGEPGTPPERRRLAQSPMKDLAALRVSLSGVAMQAAAMHPHPVDGFDSFEEAQIWAEAVWSHLFECYARTSAVDLLPHEDIRPYLLRLHALARLVSASTVSNTDPEDLRSLVGRLVLASGPRSRA